MAPQDNKPSTKCGELFDHLRNYQFLKLHYSSCAYELLVVGRRVEVPNRHTSHLLLHIASTIRTTVVPEKLPIGHGSPNPSMGAEYCSSLLARTATRSCRGQECVEKYLHFFIGLVLD
jgi:hypothetical protein